jgi:hypothetical protein
MKKYTKEEIVDEFLITPCKRSSNSQSPLTTGLDPIFVASLRLERKAKGL